jgi:hypothetical protein
MPDDVRTPRSGGYAGGTVVSLIGIGGGLYADLEGNIYPQIVVGTPGVSVAAGQASDLDGFLTGPSITAGVGGAGVGFSGKDFSLENGASRPFAGRPAPKFGAPGLTASYGFGPYNIRGLTKLPSLLYPDGGEFNGAAFIGQ